MFKLLAAPISWCSKKRLVVSLSTYKAEHIAGSFVACQAIWLDSLLTELRIKLKKPIKLFVDNKFAIDLAKNPVSHERSKHIETKFHFLKEQVNKSVIKVVYCPTESRVIDVMTKAAKIERFEKLRKALGVVAF